MWRQAQRQAEPVERFRLNGFLSLLNDFCSVSLALVTLSLRSRRRPYKLAEIELNRILWSDWGNADPILTTHRVLGSQPLFQLNRAVAWFATFSFFWKHKCNALCCNEIKPNKEEYWVKFYTKGGGRQLWCA